ncbi:MAG: hypothetical protein M3083_22635 [Actinomycetota bacterium]|nr:hypothetical protein [Actinomycetota bacterium]
MSPAVVAMWAMTVPPGSPVSSGPPGLAESPGTPGRDLAACWAGGVTCC